MTITYPKDQRSPDPLIVAELPKAGECPRCEMASIKTLWWELRLLFPHENRFCCGNCGVNVKVVPHV